MRIPARDNQAVEREIAKSSAERLVVHSSEGKVVDDLVAKRDRSHDPVRGLGP